MIYLTNKQEASQTSKQSETGSQIKLVSTTEQNRSEHKRKELNYVVCGGKGEKKRKQLFLRTVRKAKNKNRSSLEKKSIRLTIFCH